MNPHKMRVSAPVVSIGMPVYNGEKHIREALNTLLAQSFAGFELILSDNASTDDTASICKEYAAHDSRIRYIRQSTNLGAMANFRFVLEEAVGEYFMWAATDDRWDPEWLATLVQRFDTSVCVAFGSVVTFLEDGVDEKRFAVKPIQGSRIFRMLRCYFWSEWGQKANVTYGLYRAAALRKAAAAVIGNCTDFRVCLDDLLVFKALEYGCLRVEPCVTFYKRGRPDLVRYRQTRLLTWRHLWRSAAILLKFDYVPYLVELLRQSPPGVIRCAVLAATPLKYGWMVIRGLGPAFSAFAKSFRHLARHNGTDHHLGTRAKPQL